MKEGKIDHAHPQGPRSNSRDRGGDPGDDRVRRPRGRGIRRGKLPGDGNIFRQREWIFPKLTFKCGQAHRQFELTKAASTVQSSAALSECKTEIGPGTISPNECSFVLTLENKLAVDFFNGPLDVACPAEKKVALVSATCEIKVENQVEQQEVQYLNTTEAAPKKSIRVELTTDLTYNVTKDGIGCPLSKLGVAEDGEIRTTATTTGKDAEGKAVGIWVE